MTTRPVMVAVAALACLACNEGEVDWYHPPRDTDAADASGDVADAADAEVLFEVEVTTPTCEGTGSERLRLAQVGTQLVDGDGRGVRLRGVNAGGRAKVAPFVPFAFADVDPEAPPFPEAVAAYYDRIADWGLNVVRMPFTWEAIEPVRGTYDEVFLGRLDAMVRAAGERHIRVVLDFHQDVFARRYCGDGFPEWALGDPDGERPADCTRWFMNYFQNADMMADFDRFWANDDGLRDAFEALWTMLAERYGDVDAVIGFEIMNEPGWGTNDPTTFSREVLTPFYSRMVEVVHAVSPDMLVFVDPTGLDGVTGDTALGRPVGSGIVFAPHYYNALAMSGTGVPDAHAVAEVLGKWQAVGAAWDVPVLIGEFGLPHDTPEAELFMRAQWDAFDVLGLHGTQWEYSVTGDAWNAESMSVVEADGSERVMAAELVRAYPVAVAGELGAWTFDRVSGAGAIALEASGVTLVKAPARLYPGGPAVEVVEGEACTRWDAERELLIIGAVGHVRVRFSPQPD